MANSVFENALETMRQTMRAVEEEISRFAGVYQQTEALRVQQKDLQRSVQELAAKIPESKQQMEDAHTQAAAIIAEARREKSLIIAAGERRVSDIIDEANAEAKKIIARAQTDVARYDDTLSELKRNVDEQKALHADVTNQLTTAQVQFNKLKKQVATIIALE